MPVDLAAFWESVAHERWSRGSLFLGLEIEDIDLFSAEERTVLFGMLSKKNLNTDMTDIAKIFSSILGCSCLGYVFDDACALFHIEHEQSRDSHIFLKLRILGSLFLPLGWKSVFLEKHAPLLLDRSMCDQAQLL